MPRATWHLAREMSAKLRRRKANVKTRASANSRRRSGVMTTAGATSSAGLRLASEGGSTAPSTCSRRGRLFAATVNRSPHTPSFSPPSVSLSVLTEESALPSFREEELLIELRHVALDLKIPANQLLEEAIQDWLRKHSGKR